jgi:hypothetical protein
MTKRWEPFTVSVTERDLVGDADMSRCAGAAAGTGAGGGAGGACDGGGEASPSMAGRARVRFDGGGDWGNFEVASGSARTGSTDSVGLVV